MIHYINKVGLLILLTIMTFSYATAQIGINSDGTAPDSSAILDIASSDKGMLIPRLSTSAREAINAPATGLMVYDTDTGSFWYYENDQWNEIPNKTPDPTLSQPDIIDIGREEDMLSPPGDATALTKQGDFLYYVDDVDNFYAVDVSNPEEVFFTDTIDFPGNNVLEDLAIKGNYAYIVDRANNTNNLYVVDISDPTALNIIASYNVGSTINAITISGDYAYCYDWAAEELIVLIVADPTFVSVVGTLPSIPSNTLENEGNDIVIRDNNLFILHSYQGTNSLACSAIDISDVNNPSLLSTVQVGALLYDEAPYQLLNVKNQYLYVGSRSFRSSDPENVIIDASDANNLLVAGNFPTTGGMVVSDSYLLASTIPSDNTHLRLFDLSDPLNPALVDEAEYPQSNDFNIEYKVINGAYLYYFGEFDKLGSVKIFEEYVSTQIGEDTYLKPLYDDLGSHTLEQNFKTNGYWISNDGDNEGIWIKKTGRVGIRTSDPSETLDVIGSVKATSFVGDGSNLTNLNVPDYSTVISDLQSDVADNQSDISDNQSDISNNQNDISNLQTDVSNLQNDLQQAAPIGTIQMWPTNTPPAGWLICNGSTFNTSTYPGLNTVLGGNTLPDFNGRFPLGVGNSGTNGSTQHNLSSSGGEEKHQLTVNEMPSHSHGSGSLATTQPYLSQNGSGTQDKRDGGGTKLYEYTSITGNTSSVGGNQAHNNMPPFYTINFIIKAQ